MPAMTIYCKGLPRPLRARNDIVKIYIAFILVIHRDLIYQVHILIIGRDLIYQARTFIKPERNEIIGGNPHFR